MIPLTRVLVDNLHMFLRVSDELINLLLLELKRLDSIDKALKVETLDSLETGLVLMVLPSGLKRSRKNSNTEH